MEETNQVTAGVMVKQFAIPMDSQRAEEMTRLTSTSDLRPTRDMTHTDTQLEMRPRTIPRMRKMIEIFAFMLMS